MVEEFPQPQVCFKCNGQCVDDDFCYGCRNYVCDDCDINSVNMPFGGHARELHLLDPDDPQPGDPYMLGD